MELSDQDITIFNNALRNASDYDFTDYSEKSIKRRIAKILMDNHQDFDAFIRKLKEDRSFVEFVVKEITVNTTELLRDPGMWQVLLHQILPKYKDQNTLNIWHAGCSTGQEVYSMMILLKEADLFDKARIYATDINSDVLEQAKSGVYKYRFNIGYLDNFDKVMKENPFNYEKITDVPYEKYFTIDKVKDTLTMHDFLLQKPVFRKHDLVKDSNIFHIKYDIIFCRNVMIYFNYKLQNYLFRFFYDNLYDEGHLVLGKQETVRGGFSYNFEKQSQVYIKKSKLIL